MKAGTSSLAAFAKIIPLPAAADAVVHPGLNVWRVPLQDGRDRGLDRHRDEAQPKCRPLGYKKAASADPKQQDGNGGNLYPVHFLDQTDQPAMNSVPIAPITD